MSTHPKSYDDPSINECAIALAAEAISAINGRVLAGERFYVARAAVLEAAAERWVSSYGRECADKAVRALHALAPHEILDHSTKRTVAARRTADTRTNLTRLDPTRDTWINRAFLSAFGMRLYAVAAAVLLASLALQPVTVRAGDNPHLGKNWRALALCGVSKPGTSRERACRQFSVSERSTWRGYDAPGGTPRTWELPRSWEIEP